VDIDTDLMVILQ